MKNGVSVLAVVTIVFCAGFVYAAPADSTRVFVLAQNWYVHSSEGVGVTGADLSRISFQPADWYKAEVPSTVLGTMVANGVYKDPFRGRNLDNIPDSIFNKPWWYRTTFTLPQKSRNFNHVALKFLGINYKADIWLNGKLIAGKDSVFGGFRQFEFDITNEVKLGGMNALAVEMTKPGPGSLTLGFVDWSPEPPDRDMGIWRPVQICVTGDVAINTPFVASQVDTVTLKQAELTVSAELRNETNGEIAGTLEGRIGEISFSQEVKLPPNGTKLVAFSPRDFHQLIVKNPRLWWTQDFGKPNLYSLHLEFKQNGNVADSKDVKFGIRQINDYINPEGFRGYKLNGKKILIRGGGWADQIFLDQTKQNLEAQIDYAVNMHLNTIRMEGFWGESSEIYNFCDEKGILIMVGFSCQWEWKNIFGIDNDEYGCIKSPEDMATAAHSFKDQILWLRNHPSVFVWLYGSDLFPRPELEKKYQMILSEFDTTRPYLASAAEHTSTLTGPSAVKMRGPYDYVPPIYWFADTAFGGAFGFNTETGPGPQVPRIESLKKMLSPDSLWPMNGEWFYHCSRGRFRDLGRYNNALYQRLGTPTDLIDYERKAQYLNYEAMRAMFEAFGANKFKSTGLIQWMYNSAWPKLWWQFYDYYLDPTGAFYGAQKACEPIHIEYNPADQGIVVVNSTLEPSLPLTMKARVLDFNLSERFSLDRKLTIPANTSEEIAKIPAVDSLSRTYFVDLRLLQNPNDGLVSSNFYPLSVQQDSLQWKKSTWFVTESSYADLTELNQLKDLKLETKSQIEEKDGDYLVTAILHNPTDALAFQVYLAIKKGNTGEYVFPIFWDDNYITLLPGETRIIKGRFHAVDMNGESPSLETSGWNIK